MAKVAPPPNRDIVVLLRELGVDVPYDCFAVSLDDEDAPSFISFNCRRVVSYQLQPDEAEKVRQAVQVHRVQHRLGKQKMNGIDPQDAGTVVALVVEDQFRHAAGIERQVVVVRLQRHLRRRVDALPVHVKVRPAPVTGQRPRHQLAAEHVTFAATYSRYEASRITRQLRQWFRDGGLVRVSSVRALMKSVRLPAVKETTEFEELL